MRHAEITELLKQLRSQMAEGRPLSDSDRERLRTLSEDIDALLAQPDSAARHESVTDQLGEAVLRFEVSHPDITGVLASVSKALADMGI